MSEQHDHMAAGPEAGRFPALRSRDFRLYWIGQTISMVGSSMQSAAIDWHIWQLTHWPLALGLVGLSRLVPIVALSLVGGAVADARDRRRVLIATQSLLAMVAAALAALTFTHHVRAIAIYALTATAACCLAFDNPARQSLIPNLVPQEHLYSAISVMSITMRMTRIVGPLAAGLLIASGSIASTYALNSLSFVAVIVALVAIRMPTSATEAGERSDVSIKALREGLVFVWSTPILVWTIALDFIATFFSSADSLLPIFATTILHVDARGYGLLGAASAVGTLIASATMASRPPPARQGRTILTAVGFYGICTVVFGLSTVFWFSWIALATVGASDTVSTILRQTIRQSVTPDRLRGRMTAVNMVFFMGGPQLGEMEAGAVANWFGARWSVVSGGIGCLIAGAWIAVKAKKLREYR